MSTAVTEIEPKFTRGRIIDCQPRFRGGSVGYHDVFRIKTAGPNAGDYFFTVSHAQRGRYNWLTVFGHVSSYNGFKDVKAVLWFKRPGVYHLGINNFYLAHLAYNMRRQLKRA